MSFYLPSNSRPAAPGLPLDGLAGQALLKVSDFDFDAEWGDLPANGGEPGGTTAHASTHAIGGADALAPGAIGAELAGAAAAAQSFAIQRGNHVGEQAISTVTGLDAALGAKADLADGVIPTSQIPSVALVQFLGAVASQSAMLALQGQPGDWAIRTDHSTQWVIVAGNGSTLSDWYEMPNGISPVASVNGQTGSVILGTGDLAESGGSLFFTAARAIGSALTGFTAGAGTVTAADSVLQAIQKIVGNIANQALDGYAPGRWTCGLPTNAAQGTTPGATNIIEMIAFRVKRRMVIDGLAGRVTTSSPGVSFQLAIYDSTSQGDITGIPIIHTANMSAASTTLVQATTGLTPATATLEAYRLYWFAVAYGSSNIALTAQAHSDLSSFYETSVENFSFWTGHSSVAITRRLTSVYGSWPNMTGASTTLISGNRGALPLFRIASLP
ncbi:MAG: hypothetical protein FJ083_13910 [Cyanobacteria bacterium K_Offshore_surface_m2_239]|nr:hypothetical protein [Cyanobacteria bacterium K_Offshore_surface_m2_239]